MPLGIYIRKLLNLDVREDYIFLKTRELYKLKSNKIELSGTNTLKGNFQNDTTILLSNEANLQVDRAFIGKIIGKGNNIVRVNNKVSGLIICEKLIFMENGKFNGHGWCQQLILHPKASLEGSEIKMDIVDLPHKIAPEDLTVEFIDKLIKKTLL